MATQIDQIAAELFSRFGINLPAAASKWLDDYITSAIKAAVEKVTEELEEESDIDCGWWKSRTEQLTIERDLLWADRDSLKQQLESDAGYRLAKLLRDKYWAQTPRRVAKLANEVLTGIAESKSGDVEVLHDYLGRTTKEVNKPKT